MVTYALDKPEPGTIILISGDRDFAYAVSVLRMRKWEVVVIMPQVNGHDSMRYAASVVLDWGTCVTVKSESDKGRQSRAPPASMRSLTESTLMGATLNKHDRLMEAYLEKPVPRPIRETTAGLVREDVGSRPAIFAANPQPRPQRKMSYPPSYAGSMMTNENTSSNPNPKLPQPLDSFNTLAVGEEMRPPTKTYADEPVQTISRSCEALGVQMPERLQCDALRNSECMSTSVPGQFDGIVKSPSFTSALLSPHAHSDIASLQESPRSRINYMTWLDEYQEDSGLSRTAAAVPSSPISKVTFSGWSRQAESSQTVTDPLEPDESRDAWISMSPAASSSKASQLHTETPPTSTNFMSFREVVPKLFQGGPSGPSSVPVTPTIASLTTVTK